MFIIGMTRGSFRRAWCSTQSRSGASPVTAVRRARPGEKLVALLDQVPGGGRVDVFEHRLEGRWGGCFGHLDGAPELRVDLEEELLLQRLVPGAPKLEVTPQPLQW